MLRDELSLEDRHSFLVGSEITVIVMICIQNMAILLHTCHKPDHIQ